MASHRNLPRLVWMYELPMAALLISQNPTITTKQF